MSRLFDLETIFSETFWNTGDDSPHGKKFEELAKFVYQFSQEHISPTPADPSKYAMKEEFVFREQSPVLRQQLIITAPSIVTKDDENNFIFSKETELTNIPFWGMVAYLLPENTCVIRIECSSLESVEDPTGDDDFINHKEWVFDANSVDLLGFGTSFNPEDPPSFKMKDSTTAYFGVRLTRKSQYEILSKEFGHAYIEGFEPLTEFNKDDEMAVTFSLGCVKKIVLFVLDDIEPDINDNQLPVKG